MAETLGVGARTKQPVPSSSASAAARNEKSYGTLTLRHLAIRDFQRSRIVSRLDLLDGVWGDASEAASSSLEVLVGRLRRKLGAELIRTLRGEGYALMEAR